MTGDCPLREYAEHRIFRIVTRIDGRDAASLLELVHDGASESGVEFFPPMVLLGLAGLIPSDACVGYQRPMSPANSASWISSR